MSYTKGPWTNEDYEITADDGSVICSVNSIDDFPCIDQDNDPEQLRKLVAELEANARLITAAPELIEACKAVQAAVKDSIANRLSMNNMKYDDVGQQLVKAIAKAEGQP